MNIFLGLLGVALVLWGLASLYSAIRVLMDPIAHVVEMQHRKIRGTTNGIPETPIVFVITQLIFASLAFYLAYKCWV